MHRGRRGRKSEVSRNSRSEVRGQQRANCATSSAGLAIHVLAADIARLDHSVVYAAKMARVRIIRGYRRSPPLFLSPDCAKPHAAGELVPRMRSCIKGKWAEASLLPISLGFGCLGWVSVHGDGGNSAPAAVCRSGVGGGGHRPCRLSWSCKTSTVAERRSDDRREIGAIRFAGEGW
jgi:hypothetical protein